MNSPSPRAVIIMRSKDSDWVIAQSLAGLFAQEYRDFDLHIVDSGSRDRTLQIAREFPCRITEIASRDYYPGAVLNQAISQTHHEIIVFQNSDAVPLSPRSLGHLIRAFDDTRVQAAFARQIPRPEAEPWVRRDYAASFPASGKAPDWLPFSLPLAAMRRTIWQQRPFQTATWGSEDVEWGFWAQRHKVPIRYVPNAVVMHSHNYTLRQLYGRRFIEGEADAFIHRAHLTVTQTFLRILRSSVRDLAAFTATQAWSGLPQIPAIRFVYHWAYHQGHRWGERRLQQRDPDASLGQSVVLDRQ